MLNDEEVSFIFIKYIHQTMINQANKYYKKKSINDKDFKYEENLTESKLVGLYSLDYENHQDPSTIIISKDTLKRIDYNFKNLSSADKQLLFEKYIGNKSDREIASKFGISSQAVSKRKRKILSKLRDNI